EQFQAVGSLGTSDFLLYNNERLLHSMKGGVFLSKLIHNFIQNKILKNDSTPSTGSGLSGFTRDPKQVKAKRIGYQINNSGGSGQDSFEESEIDLSVIEEVISGDSYLSQAVLKYQELNFKSGWDLTSSNEQALEYVKQRLAMIEIATGIPLDEFFQNIARDIVWSSNCFIVKARAKNGVGLPPGLTLTPILPSKEPVVGYFTLPPQTVTISRDENGTILKYKQEVDGGDDAV